MRKLISITLILLASISCQETNQPEDLISEDQLVSILIDIHVTEGIASSLPIPYDSSQIMYSLLEKEIFLKHQISDSVFNKNLLIYLKDPVKMDEIYSRVVDSLSKKQAIQASENLNK